MFKSKSKKKREDFAKDAGEFAHNHSGSLCIMIDTKDNVVVTAFKDFVSANRNKGTKITLENLVKMSPDEKRREKAFNQLMAELDGSFWAISEQLEDGKLKDKGFSDRTIAEAKKMFGFQEKDEKGNTKEVVSFN